MEIDIGHKRPVDLETERAHALMGLGFDYCVQGDVYRQSGAEVQPRGPCRDEGTGDDGRDRRRPKDQESWVTGRQERGQRDGCDGIASW